MHKIQSFIFVKIILKYNSLVYLFGGTKKNETFPDMFALDVESWTWRKIQTTGNKPIVWGYSLCVTKFFCYLLILIAVFYRLTATVVGNRIYYFGGEGIGSKLNDILFIFDTSTNKWSTPDVSGAGTRILIQNF
jgi:N-acetylneuraminic acid mutarotase